MFRDAHPRPRLRWRFDEWVSELRLVRWLLSPTNTFRYRHLPSLPTFVTRFLGTEPPLGPRPLEVPDLPQQLRTAPGIPLGPDEDFPPLPVFTRLHHEMSPFLRRKMWRSFLRGFPGFAKGMLRVAEAPTDGRGVAVPVDPVELTDRLKAKAAEIGFTAVGVAELEDRWVYEDFRDDIVGDRVVVCALEQNWEATQTIPSAKAERAALNAYARGIPMADDVADYLRSLGYAARAGDAGGQVVSIAFAVAAGMGQLGLNGQLLTPFAGSRCRLFSIVTNAPLAPDKPVDYGVPAICDACQICVRRCPSGAITRKRQMHRGVYKAKIKTERCIPMMAAAEGCAVCMKVCPVQRYGLARVVDEYRRSGRIVGKETDELEGFTWPVDGIHYGPGKKPRSAVTNEFLHPRGLVFDPHRTLVQTGTAELEALEQRIREGREVEF